MCIVLDASALCFMYRELSLPRWNWVIGLSDGCGSIAGHRATAAGALVTGLGSLALARRPAQTRRRFLKNGLGIASGVSFAILVGQTGLSEWTDPEELAAYDHADQQLARMQAELRRN